MIWIVHGGVCGRDMMKSGALRCNFWASSVVWCFKLVCHSQWGYSIHHYLLLLIETFQAQWNCLRTCYSQRAVDSIVKCLPQMPSVRYIANCKSTVNNHGIITMNGIATMAFLPTDRSTIQWNRADVWAGVFFSVNAVPKQQMYINLQIMLMIWVIVGCCCCCCLSIII